MGVSVQRQQQRQQQRGWEQKPTHINHHHAKNNEEEKARRGPCPKGPRRREGLYTTEVGRQEREAGQANGTGARAATDTTGQETRAPPRRWRYSR